MTMVPVMTSFLPLAQAQLYLPALFAIWEASNSSIIDDRFLELAGDLSEEYVLEASEHNGLVWRDIGIWSESQWHTLIGKGLASMSSFFRRVLDVVTYINYQHSLRCTGWPNWGLSLSFFILSPRN